MPVSERTMYSAQDDCLVAIADGDQPLSVERLMKLPPYRAWLIARIARKAGIGLEFGTIEQLRAEADKVGSKGTLGRWWEK